MPRLFVTAGHSRQDPGATANGLMEALLTMELRDLVSKECRALGAEVINDNDDHTLKQVIKQIFKVIQPTEALLDIHFNSSEGQSRGVEAFIAMEATQEEKDLATLLCYVVSQTLGTTNRGVKLENQSQHTRLGILHTGGRSTLLEVCFITNKAEAQIYLQQKNQVAKRIAQVLVPLPIPLDLVASLDD